MILKACATCGRPSPDPYCSEHRRKAWATSTRKSHVTLSGSAEQARRKRILKRYLHCCHYCGKVREPSALDVDHVLALGLGGRDVEANLAPICRETCHRAKSQAEARRARA